MKWLVLSKELGMSTFRDDSSGCFSSVALIRTVMNSASGYIRLVVSLTGASDREWLGMRVAGIIINGYGLDHSLIPDLKHQ